METEVLVALITAGGLVGVALVGFMIEIMKRSNKVVHELEGNGNGTMLNMVTAIYQTVGRIEGRLDSLEDRVDGLEADWSEDEGEAP